MKKSFELAMSPDYSSSQNLVLVKSASPKRSTKITARAENLLAIHRKIMLHLRNEKPLAKFELRKLLSIVKRIDCSSPRDKTIAESAQDILVKCICSQTSKNRDQKLQRILSNTTSDSSSTNESELSANTDDGPKAKRQLFDARSETAYGHNNSLKYINTENASMLLKTESHQYLNPVSEGRFDDSYGSRQLFSDIIPETTYNVNNNNHLQYTLVSTSHKTETEQYRNMTSSPDIFSSQIVCQDDRMSSVKKVTSQGKSNSHLATNVALSHTFLKRHGSSFNASISNDRSDNGSLDNDNVSVEPFTVPTLLENDRNIGVSQESNVLKLRLADVQFDSNTVSIPIELLTNLNFGSGETQSEDKNNIRKAISHNDFSFSISASGNEQGNKISGAATSKNHINIPSSSSISDITPTPNNTEIDISNFKSPQESNDLSNLKGTLYISSGEKKNVGNSKPLLKVSYARHSQHTSCKSNSNANLSKESGGSFENAWRMPSNNLSNATLNTLVPYQNAWEPTNKKCDVRNATLSVNTKNFKNAGALPSNTIHYVRNATSNCSLPETNTKFFANGNANFENAWGMPNHNTKCDDNAASNASAVNDKYVHFNNSDIYNVPVVRNTTVSNANAENFENVWYVPSYNKCIAKCVDSNASVTNAGSVTFENSLWLPLEDLAECRNINLESETPDLKNCGFGILEESMELRKSQGDLSMTEAEERYLEVSANNTEIEIIDLTRDQNAFSKVMTKSNGIEGDEGSFVFDLDTGFNSEFIIEGTPVDKPEKLPLQRKIKAFSSKNPGKQLLSERITSETQEIIIDETPCIESESPVIHDIKLSSQSIKVKPQNSKEVGKRHNTFNPYKNWPRSNRFQEMYKSNYQRKTAKTSFQNSKINVLKNIKLNREDGIQSLDSSTSQDKNVNDLIRRPSTLNTGVNASPMQSTNNSLIQFSLPLPNKNAKEESSTLKNQDRSISENIVLIDGEDPINTEPMDTTPVEPEEKESFKEMTRKLEEKIVQKRKKYKDSWNARPVAEKVSLKYVRKFGVNIYEDSASSLLNIGYKVNLGNFHFTRLTRNEMNKELKKLSEKAHLLNEALTKTIDHQISTSNVENYRFKMDKDRAASLDSDDSSDEDEESKDKRMLEEIRIMSRLEMKKFMEEMEKKRKEDDVLKRERLLLRKDHDVEEREEKRTDEGPPKLLQLLRKAGDFSWLK